MILLLIGALLIGPGIGAGVATFVRRDALCREAHKATRIRGAMLEVYCDD